MRLMLISLDLMLALPIVSGTLFLLFGNFYNAQSYLSESARLQDNTISLYYRSELITSVISGADQDFTEANDTVNYFSGEYRINATLKQLNSENSDFCSGSGVCRIVTSRHGSYLLTVGGNKTVNIYR